MKQWAYYDELKNELKPSGLKGNILESQSTVLEHLADVRGSGCLVSGNSPCIGAGHDIPSRSILFPPG
jgi:hypothetical protein